MFKKVLMLVAGLSLMGCYFDGEPEGEDSEDIEEIAQTTDAAQKGLGKLTKCVLRCLDAGDQCRKEKWPSADCTYVADKCIQDYCGHMIPRPTKGGGSKVGPKSGRKSRSKSKSSPLVFDPNL